MSMHLNIEEMKNMFDTSPSSLIDSKCESEVKIVEKQGVGAHSLVRRILKGIRACWSSGMGIGRITST